MNVIESSLNVAAGAPIRVEPVQARSTARVNALLDAASATMHDFGYEQLTTAMVAERAGASIGTVYRYFPDRVAVLNAVAARNLDQVRTALRSAFEERKPSDIPQAIDVLVETLVELFRIEKGFRSLRVGDVLDIRPASTGRGGNAEIATVFRDYLHENLNIKLDSSGRLACETAVDTVDALLARAFLHSDRGDQTLIAEAQRMAHCSIEGPAA
jgi:AcrR family transcriptional regulator